MFAAKRGLLAFRRVLPARLLTAASPFLVAFIYLASSSPLVYAASPTVSTSAASNLTKTTATLNASATNSGGKPITQRGFQYGATTSYGQTTTENVAITHSFSTQWGWDITANGALNQPNGVAIDSSGNVYVADTANNRIQKFNSSGTYVTKWGSYGTGNGQFSSPNGVELDSSGNVYVADTGNNRIQKFDASGTFVSKWGSSGTGNGQFNNPRDIAVDTSGNIFVLDRNNNRVQKFNSSGTYVTKWGSYGTGNSQFSYPNGLAVDSGGNVYVADSDNSRILKYNNSGTYVIKWGSLGSGNGQFSTPWGIALDSSGNMYISEAGNNRVQKLNSSGTYVTKWGSTGTGDGQFNGPSSIALDSSGNIYVAEYSNNRVQKFSSSGTYVTKWGGRDDTANGQFNSPNGITTDSSGNIYVLDSSNNRIQKFDSNGTYITQWGGTGSGDGEFFGLQAITADSSDNIYVVEYWHHRVQKFDSNGTYITQWGYQGCAYDDMMTDESLCFPTGIAADPADNIYVVDTDNNRIQKFDSNGIYLGVLGEDAGFGVQNISIDSAGNIYTTSPGFITKYDNSGVYVTDWGGFGTGNGQFGYQTAVTSDFVGNVYVADTGNNRIQKFDSNGTYITQWGSQGGGGNGQFSTPSGITSDLAGNIYIADTGNNLIQKYAASPNTGSFLANIAGLTCETTYHYRAYSTNTDSTSYGSDATFTTTACPQPAVSTGAASGIGSNNATTYFATVAANVTNIGDSALTNVGIQYGLTTSYGSAVNNSSGTVGVNSFNLTGLTCETTYHYRALATNSYGTRYGSDATFTTSACPTPASVTTGSAHDIDSANYTNFSATLDLTINDTGNSLVAQAGFQYGLDTSYGSTVTAVGSHVVGSESAVVANLICETTYHYRAFATNVYGTVVGSDATFVTSACPTPAVVTTGDPTDVTSEYAEIEAEVVEQGNSNLTDVGVKFGVNSPNENSVSSGGAVLGANIVLLDGLYCETTYHYTAYVTNAYGTTYGDDASFTTGICEPDPPTDIVAEFGSATSINVSWQAPGFTGMGVIDHYNLYFREVGTTSWQVQEGSSDATADELVGLERGVQYEIKVTAVNVNDFESIDSEEVIARAGFYQIRNCADLQAINNNLSAFYELTNDIDCSDSSTWNSGAGFMPLGTCVVDIKSPDFSTAFTGILAGNAHTVSNLYTDTFGFGSCTAAGLVGLADGALFQDLKLDNLSVVGNDVAGGLGALTQNTDVINVQISDGSVEGDTTGGLIGLASFDDTFSGYTQSRNSFTGAVTSACSTGSAPVGGLYGMVVALGQSEDATGVTFDSSYSNASILVTSAVECGSYVGGTVGLMQGNVVTHVHDMYGAGEIIADIPSGDGKFSNPQGLAADSAGNVYVADADNRRIQKFDVDGTYLGQWGTFGTGDGQFDGPRSVTIDTSDNVYVADTYNDRIQKFDTNGTYLGQWGTFGTGDGQFDSPASVSIDASNNLYVVDTGNSRIQKFNSNGTYLGQWGTYGNGNGQLNGPQDSAVGTDGTIYVSDYGNNRIQKFDTDGTYLGQWGGNGSGNGQLSGPKDVAVDVLGNLYVVDSFNNRIQKFDTDGNYLSKWGTYGTGDGAFQYPFGIATDSEGNVYVGDTGNNRIQKFDSSTNYLTKWGGSYSTDSFAAGGFAGVYYTSASSSTLEFTFAHLSTTATSGQVGGLTGVTGSPHSLSTNYFDADLAGTQTCALYSALECNAVLGDSDYFYNNSINPPLDEWDFDNLWETTSTLPVFRAEAVNTITPISSERLNRDQQGGGGNGGGPTGLVAQPTPDQPKSPGPSTPGSTSNNRQASPGPSSFLEKLKDLLSKIPEPILRSFPYILFGGLSLGALVMILQAYLQAQQLKVINLQLAQQRAIAQQRDTFWHLAANYLRAPITLLMGGVELLQSSPAGAKSLGAAVATSAAGKNGEAAVLIDAITKLVGSMQHKIAKIMDQIEGSKTLQDISWPKERSKKRILTSPGFWIPMACVAALTVLANYIARNIKNLDVSTLQIFFQFITFFIVGMFVYWAANLLGLARHKRERAERRLASQRVALDKARSTLIGKTAAVLDGDVANLELLTNSLPAKEPARPILYEGTRRLRQMVDSFALLVKAQNNDLQSLSPSTAQTSLQDILDEAAHELQAEMDTKGLKLVKPTKQHVMVPGSSRLVAQVVSSVLTNAVDFSPNNAKIGIKINVAAGETTLFVTDQGPGISPDQQADIFEPFTKADGQDALQMDHEGLGINLYLDRKIMDFLRGDIELTSLGKKGTVVTITWPNK